MSNPPPIAFFSSAEKYMQEKQFQQAVTLFEKIPPTDPLYPVSRANIGLCLMINKQHDIGLKIIEDAVKLAPDNAKVWSAQGQAVQIAGDNERAMAAFKKAIQIDPNHIKSHLALANLYADKSENRQAIAHLKAILRLQPDSASVHFKIGKIHFFDGHIKKALKFFERAQALDPTSDENWLLGSHAYFLHGDIAKGFAAYRNRFNYRINPQTQRARALSPQWRGEDLQGKSILVIWEQGLGDSLQNFRYLPKLMAMGAKVHLCIQDIMVAFAHTFEGLESITTTPEDLPTTDYHAPFFEIAAYLHERGDDIYLSATVPYLNIKTLPQPDWVDAIKEKAAQKIGIVWQGSPGHSRDSSRSVPLSAFHPLSELPNTEVYSLQTLNGLDQLTDQDWLINLEPQIMTGENGLSALAHVVDQMDIIVCCDTMICHLAGAMNKDVRLMVSTIPDWRWPLEEATTPWYPNTTLYQRGRRESWESVLNRIKAELEQS